METVTFTKDDLGYYISKITKEFDKHLKPNWKEMTREGYTSTYVMEKETFNGANVIPIRYPGATRGHIELDSNDVITRIVLYDTCYNIIGCYESTLKEVTSQFVGFKAVFEE